MYFIILWLLLTSSLYMYPMDQDTQEDYAFEIVEQYHSTLQQLLTKNGNDPALWMKSCKQAGQLQACLDLNTFGNQSARESILSTLKNHDQTMLILIERMALEEKLAAAIEKE